MIQGDLGFTPHPSTASSMSASLSSGTSIDLITTNSTTPFTADSDIEKEGEELSLWESAAELAIQEAVEGYTRPLKTHDWDRAALLNLRAFMLPSVYDYSCIDSLPVLVVQGKDDGALTQNATALVEILKESREQNKNMNGAILNNKIFSDSKIINGADSVNLTMQS